MGAGGFSRCATKPEHESCAKDYSESKNHEVGDIDGNAACPKCRAQGGKAKSQGEPEIKAVCVERISLVASSRPKKHGARYKKQNGFQRNNSTRVKVNNKSDCEVG